MESYFKDDQNSMNDYHDLIKLSANSIRQSIIKERLDPITMEFMLWLLDDDNLHQENYLRMLGVAGSIELELQLFQKIEKQGDFKELKKDISLLNAYFAFETLSDNLAVDLASIRPHDRQQSIRRHVLLAFNNLMIRKLMGNRQDISQSLEPLHTEIEKISVNNQTLSPTQMQIFIDDYKKIKKEKSMKLEYTFFSILVLNIATCLQLLSFLKDSPLYLILKHSLIKRYLSVNRIIQYANQSSCEKLHHWGRDSILTVPTFAFCIASLNKIDPNQNINKVIQNGLLYSVMCDGALLTRLLNDIGTNLLTMTQNEREDYYDRFLTFIHNKNDQSLMVAIQGLAEHQPFRQCLTRIRKDLQHGEYNVCLDNIRQEPMNIATLKRFFSNIDFYATIYQKTYKTMISKLQDLENNLHDNAMSSIIYHFVKFHEYKYSYNYETVRGDYAITNNK